MENKINIANSGQNKSKSFTEVFIKKIVEEFNRNENTINNDLIKPMLRQIYENTYHYFYFIFILLILLVLLSIINFITLIYYIRKRKF